MSLADINKWISGESERFFDILVALNRMTEKQLGSW
jgi:hypothetical protein